MSPAIRWMAFVLGLAFCRSQETSAAPTAGEDNEWVKSTVSLDEVSPQLDAGKKALAGALKGILPKNGVAPAVSKAGGFALWGDLFKTGGCFALADLPDWGGFAFAEWTGGAWQLRGLWKIPTAWRPDEWINNGDLPIKPAAAPFILEDLSGDRVPELIVAGAVDKYFQDHHLLQYSSKTSTLNLLATSMGKPERSGDCVRLYFNSGRRAIYSEWRFLKWVDEKLAPVASWHDEVGYNESDPTFVEGERETGAGKTEVIRVLYGGGMQENSDSYPLTKDGKAFGRMSIQWKNPDEFNDAAEKAWLFEKITKLPRALYPRRPDEEKLPKLEDLAVVSIEGDPEASKLFKHAK